jgi:hypothetical protein
MPDPTEASRWRVVIVFTDGRYDSDVFSYSAGGALQLAMTDARSLSTGPLFIGDVREVTITWQGSI